MSEQAKNTAIEPSNARSRWARCIFRIILTCLLTLSVCVASFFIRTRDRERAIEEIWKDGGNVWYDFQMDDRGGLILFAQPQRPQWQKAVFGESCRSAVIRARVMSDAGMAHIERLTELRELLLGATQVSDAGLSHIGALRHLRVLDLGYTPVTDLGFAQVKQLTELKELYIKGTHVSDQSLSDFEKAVPACTVYR
jgi:hypothetical protein